MSVWTGLAIWFIELVVVAALSASRRGARAGLALTALLLLLPAFVIGPPFILLTVLTVGVGWCAIRTADFAIDGPLDGFRARFVHLVAVVDTRLIERCPRRLDGRSLVRLLVGIAVAIAAIWLIGKAGSLDGWRHYALRWFAGGFVLAPAAFAAVDALLALIGTAFGRALPTLSDAPLLSRSVSEFWAKRWNRVVSKILHDRFYKPFAKYGTTVALLAAFAASAALHAWLIGILMGATCAASWAAFFLAQPLLILVERRLRVRHWRPLLGWLWTMSALGLLSPLFTEPLLRWFETF
ncbi:MAG TPA: MBOAT family protein [Xanthomonadaceae bacterium]|nr:MBOAT family protein [Xanthomonadaceae bacterium]